MSNKKIMEQLQKNKINMDKKQEEMRQLKNKERALKSKQRSEEERIRTRRLILRGVMLEKINPSFPSLSEEFLSKYLNRILKSEQAEKLLVSMMESDQAEPSNTAKPIQEQTQNAETQ